MQEKILIEILNELKKQNISNLELWTADDIARYMRLSRSSVQSRVFCRKDFPRAARIPTSGSGGDRRWYAKEIQAWLQRNRERLRK
ncbi:MAG: hypothetical protein QNL62_15250 [Gammaproteobacteria bacterium]|nr:hypothetical protein [Gammaproteobacteria bacterium]